MILSRGTWALVVFPICYDVYVLGLHYLVIPVNKTMLAHIFSCLLSKYIYCYILSTYVSLHMFYLPVYLSGFVTLVTHTWCYRWRIWFLWTESWGDIGGPTGLPWVECLWRSVNATGVQLWASWSSFVIGCRPYRGQCNKSISLL